MMNQDDRCVARGADWTGLLLFGNTVQGPDGRDRIEYIDMSEWQRFGMQIRDKPDATATEIATATPELLALDDQPDVLCLLTFSLSHTITATIDPGTYYTDVWGIDGEGKHHQLTEIEAFIVTKGVTVLPS